MTHTPSFARKFFAATLLAGAALFAALPAPADSLAVRSGKAELPYKNATITQVKDGEIYFTVEGSGIGIKKRLADVTRLEVANETSFNNAEKAYRDALAATDPAAAKAKYAEAVTGYQATLKSSKLWLRDFAATRLQIVAPPSGRVDAAIDAWMNMVSKSPSTASASMPALDTVDPKSQYLTEALRKLNTAKGGTNKADEKRAYLEMISAIQRHMGDLEGDIKTQRERVSIGGTPQEAAELGVAIARFEFDKKNLDGASAELAKIDPALLNDNGRADLMFINAEIRGGKLAANSPADAWKDLALEYMRLVALHPASTNSGNALVKVAEIFETHLKEPETALKVYRQVAREHANTPAATLAQKSIDRLAKSAAAGN